MMHSPPSLTIQFVRDVYAYVFLTGLAGWYLTSLFQKVDSRIGYVQRL